MHGKTVSYLLHLHPPWCPIDTVNSTVPFVDGKWMSRYQMQSLNSSFIFFSVEFFITSIKLARSKTSVVA